MSAGSKRRVAEDVADIQGIILGGYKRLPAATFVPLQIPTATDRRLVKAWVGRLADRVRYGTEKDPTTASINVAFTCSGLKRLGLDSLGDGTGLPVIEQFAAPFEVGMTTDYRQRILGDTAVNDSAPDGWLWGGPANPVDALLLLYAAPGEIDPLAKREIAEARAAGLAVLRPIESQVLPGETEHFGFRDGIANPRIKGLKDSDATIQPGEFLLGYPNEYELYAPRPLIRPADDPSRTLPLDEEGTGAGDFGRNGSYLVARQLRQDAFKFWNELNERAERDAAEREMLAAKMVGRWRGGAPIVRVSTPDDPLARDDDDNFMYHRDDPDGLKCPIGAHIRRTNPRDSLDPDPGTPRSVGINKRHRIIRRGRPYGPPVPGPIDPQQIINAGPAYDDEDRGIFFMCFNANISRQFEFIQESWLNNPKFAGLHGDTDPLMGDRGGEPSHTCSFTIPSDPVRRRVTGLPQFVHTRGGAYLFMPGGRALRFLSLLPS